MNIGITYDLKTDWPTGQADPTDLNAEFDKPETLESIVSAIECGGHHVTRIGNVERLINVMDELNVDLVFNICEGRTGRNRESQVPLLLELKNIPYVGADALTLGLTLDKIMAKKVFQGEGISTPRFFKATPYSNLEQLNHIGFPLIVKTRHEGSSKGIHQASRVKDIEELKKKVAYIHDTYHQSALVEEFVSGKEFTVAVLGNECPIAMPVVQVSIDGQLDLGNKFYTNDRIYSDALRYICPAEISPTLTQTIQNLAVQVYQAVDCRDLARVDFRVDQNDQPYVLEINPLPSFDKEDVFHLFPRQFGYDFQRIINIIIDLALVRCRLTDKSEQEILKPFQLEVGI